MSSPGRERDSLIGSSEEEWERPPRSPVRTIGRYRLAFQLASGGMATVFLGRAEGPGGFEKLVALKRIHPHLAKQSAYVDMFLDEARIASRITHPNVCSVFDFGEAEGEYFIAMEYLVGEPLSRVARALVRGGRLQESPRYPAFCAQVIASAAEGLHAAHELTGAAGELLGVVHRDVSPQNLFVSYDGVVRVVDFGIAKAADKLHETLTGEVKGKAAYMSPEQIRDGRSVDRRTDVWALGTILWEMLTLRRLFKRGAHSETMYAVMEQEVPAPSGFTTHVSADLDEIVARALTRDLDRRYATARDFAQALRRYLSSTGQPFGTFETGEWMRTLFPQGETRARQLMDLARSDLDEDRDSDIAIPAPDGSETTGTISAIRVVSEPEPPGIGRAGWLLGALLLALVGGGGVVAGSLLGGSPSTRAGGGAPSQPVVEPPPPVAQRPQVAEVEETPAVQPDPPDVPAVPSESEEDVQASVATREAVAVPRQRSRPARRRRARARQESSTATPAPTPSRTAEPTTGTVVVIVRGGWANVYDERRRLLGATPLRTSLPAGRHRLELRPFGEPPAIPVEVTVTGGERTRIVREVEPR